MRTLQELAFFGGMGLAVAGVVLGLAFDGSAWVCVPSGAFIAGMAAWRKH